GVVGVGRDRDGGSPLETVMRLAGVGFRADGALMSGAHVAPGDVAVLRLGVHDPGLDVVNGGVKTIATVNHLPVFVGDAVAGERLARAAPATVILQSSADVIGLFVVQRDFIKLADGDDIEEIPIFPCIVTPMDAAVGTGDHVIGIGGIDPHGVIVSVNAMDALGGECFAAVFGVKHRRAQLPNAQIIVGINADLAVVGRPRVRFTHALPGLAFIFAAERAALFVLDFGVNDVGIFAVDAQPDAPGIATAVLPGQAFCQFFLVCTGVDGLVYGAVRAAAVEAVWAVAAVVRVYM